MGIAILDVEFLRNAVLAGLFAGVGCSVVGVFVVTMHLSFLGVCIAHAAFAGALLGVVLDVHPLLGALIFSLASAGIVGPLADRGELSPDTSIGIVFSLMLGLAFLFLGLSSGSRTEALSLFWGSILTVTGQDVVLLGMTAGAVVVLATLFFKEIQAVICHRQVALAVGIPATLVFYCLLFATGVTVSVALRAIGGLLIYSLIVNPAAAAFQLTYSLKRMFVWSALFGVFSCWVGLAASHLWDLPAGATIVIASTLVFACASVFSPKRRRQHPLRQKMEQHEPQEHPSVF